MCSRSLPYAAHTGLSHCFLCGGKFEDAGSLHQHRLSHVGKTVEDVPALLYQDNLFIAMHVKMAPFGKPAAKLGTGIPKCYRNGIYIGETRKVLGNHHSSPLVRLGDLATGDKEYWGRCMKVKLLYDAPTSIHSWKTMMTNFKAERALSMKLRKTQTTRKRFPCRVCRKSFYHPIYLQLHAVSVHCQKTFLVSQGRQSSRRCIKHAPCNVPCQGCGKLHQSARSTGALGKTLEASHNQSLECKICHRSFAKQTSLNGHMKVHSSKSNPFCNLCHKSFPYQNSRCQHIVKTYTCNTCKAVFVDHNAYRSHVRRHSKSRPFQCPMCPKRFGQSAHLRTHIRWHRGEKPFKCPYCDRRFSQSGHLNEHKRLHTGERPFVCDYCGNAYHNSSSLRSHVRVHTGERPYQCPQCFHTFSQSSSLKDHMRAHRSAQSTSCEVCGKSFGSTTSLANHMRVHFKDHAFRCTPCGKTFAFAASLSFHRCSSQKSQS